MPFLGNMTMTRDSRKMSCLTLRRMKQSRTTVSRWRVISQWRVIRGDVKGVAGEGGVLCMGKDDAELGDGRRMGLLE